MGRVGAARDHAAMESFLSQPKLRQTQDLTVPYVRLSRRVSGANKSSGSSESGTRPCSVA